MGDILSTISYENEVHNRNIMSYISMYQRGQNQSMTNQKTKKIFKFFVREERKFKSKTFVTNQSVMNLLHVWICKRYYQIVVSPTKVHERETSFHGYIEIVDMMYTMCIVQKYMNSALYYRTGASIYHQVSFIYLFSPIFYENKVNNRNMMSYISMYQRIFHRKFIRNIFKTIEVTNKS